MSCEKHKRTIKDYKGSIGDLAADISELHYEELTVFVKALSNSLWLDAKGDVRDGRVKLAKALADASTNTSKAASHIEKAWEISKPYMK